MTETTIVNQTILKLSEEISSIRVWRSNSGVGAGWYLVRNALKAAIQGDMASVKRILTQARPIKFGLNGQADITGILPDGRRLEVEMKTATGRQRAEQKVFEQMIRSRGGVYILARSATEAVTLVQEACKKQ